MTTNTKRLSRRFYDFKMSTQSSKYPTTFDKEYQEVLREKLNKAYKKEGGYFIVTKKGVTKKIK